MYIKIVACGSDVDCILNVDLPVVAADTFKRSMNSLSRIGSPACQKNEVVDAATDDML